MRLERHYVRAQQLLSQVLVTARLPGHVLGVERQVYKYCSPTRSSFLTGGPRYTSTGQLMQRCQQHSGADLRMTLLERCRLLAMKPLWAMGMQRVWHVSLLHRKYLYMALRKVVGACGQHCGARSTANLPINRGFDHHFGFLKGVSA